jgi:hypothetical protein
MWSQLPDLASQICSRDGSSNSARCPGSATLIRDQMPVTEMATTRHRWYTRVNSKRVLEGLAEMVVHVTEKILGHSGKLMTMSKNNSCRSSGGSRYMGGFRIIQGAM